MKQIDLGRAKEYRIVLRLALPAMLAQLINVFYSIIDRLFISNLPVNGEYALAGIGIVAPICTLITSFSYLIGVGGAPLMSISLGGKNHKKAANILANSFLLLCILAVTIPVLVLCFYPLLLNTFGASQNTYEFAKNYLLIYLIGAPFALISLGLNQFIISLGYSTKGMMTMIIGAVINIIFDPIFIFSCNLGVSGAALATVLAQICSFLFTLFVLFSKKSQVRITFGNYNTNTIKKIITMGLSPFIICATDSLVCILLNSSIKLNAGNMVDEYILVSTITNSFFQIFTMPLLGISGGTGGILSFNYGAKQVKRVKRGEVFIISLALIYTTISFAISFLIRRPFISLFTNDEQIINLSIKMIGIFMYGLIILSFQYCFVDGLTALGYTKQAVTLSLIRKISIIGLTFILPFFMGIDGCFYAEFISDLLASFITLIVFVFVFKKILIKMNKNY